MKIVDLSTHSTLLLFNKICHPSAMPLAIWCYSCLLLNFGFTYSYCCSMWLLLFTFDSKTFGSITRRSQHLNFFYSHSMVTMSKQGNLKPSRVGCHKSNETQKQYYSDKVVLFGLSPNVLVGQFFIPLKIIFSLLL